MLAVGLCWYRWVCYRITTNVTPFRLHTYVRLYILVPPLQRTVMFWDLRPPPPKPGTKPPDPSVPSHLHLNLTWKPFIKVPTYLCTHLNRYVHTRKRLSVHSIQYCNVHTIQHIRMYITHNIAKVVLYILYNILYISTAHT